VADGLNPGRTGGVTSVPKFHDPKKTKAGKPSIDAMKNGREYVGYARAVTPVAGTPRAWNARAEAN
jgi:hypothetical protein